MEEDYEHDFPPTDDPEMDAEDGGYSSEPEEEPSRYPEDTDLTEENRTARLQYHIDEYYTRCWGTEPVDFSQAPDTWRWYRLPDPEYPAVQVSDAGYIRDPRTHQVTNGFSEAGSPYRVYIFQHNHYPPVIIPVHQMVWEAFRGPPPRGYKVGHNLWALREKDTFGKLPTDLGSLELCPSPYSTFCP